MSAKIISFPKERRPKCYQFLPLFPIGFRVCQGELRLSPSKLLLISRMFHQYECRQCHYKYIGSDNNILTAHSNQSKDLFEGLTQEQLKKYQ